MTTIAGVHLSNPGKALFPDGLTKADLARYYDRVADTMLPHVRGRPVHMQRYPDGIEGHEIQQKQAPDYFPGFVERAHVPRKRGGSVDHVVIENRETLVYLAGQACITPHVWLARRDRLDNPDQLIFDLDPSDGDLAPIRDAARALRRLLEEAGLVPFVKTTGSRGLHVVCPLDRSATFDQTRAFARALAGVLVERDPGRFTIEARKEPRGGRLYLDTARNGYAQTVVAPYAVRALAGAPVACPLDWREIGRVEPQTYTVRNVLRRLARKGDPWADIDAAARPLPQAASVRSRSTASSSTSSRLQNANRTSGRPASRSS
jgi:bifunctional non-homologous end joining protein LigD